MGAATTLKMPPHITERDAVVKTADGLQLEARRWVPPAGLDRGRAAICHPHPLYGGCMDNKVVETATRAAAAAGLATVRFNFRGTGRSGGSHGGGVEEVADIAAALLRADELVGHQGQRSLVGYSFGSAVAANALRAGTRVDRLVLIAPPLAMFPIPPPTVPDGVIVIVGDRDSFCPLSDARQFVQATGIPDRAFQVVVGADHFFDGHLPVVARAVFIALGGQPADTDAW